MSLFIVPIYYSLTIDFRTFAFASPHFLPLLFFFLFFRRRQQHLEEEHSELEYQIRCLMARPEANKTDSDKELEEQLIQRLVEVVERRDAIVQCLEMDRLREAEEDRSINTQLGIFTLGIYNLKNSKSNIFL